MHKKGGWRFEAKEKKEHILYIGFSICFYYALVFADNSLDELKKKQKKCYPTNGWYKRDKEFRNSD